MDYNPFLMGFGAALLTVAALVYVFCENECASCLFNDTHYKDEWLPENSAAPIPQEQEMSEEDREIWNIFRDAYARYRRGEARYGVIKKETDPRNFFVESEQELLDSIVYDGFEIMRLRALDKRKREFLDAPFPSPWGLP